MSDATYVEDRKYILSSLEKTDKNIEKLFDNDTEIKVIIERISTKMMLVGLVSTSIMGVVVAFVMNTILGIK